MIAFLFVLPTFVNAQPPLCQQEQVCKAQYFDISHENGNNCGQDATVQ